MLVLHLVTLLFVSTSMYLFTDRIEERSCLMAHRFISTARGILWP